MEWANNFTTEFERCESDRKTRLSSTVPVIHSCAGELLHKQPLARQTLKLEGLRSLPVLRSGFVLLWILSGWVLITESVARTSLGYSLPPPSVGADSFEFDIKVYYLEQAIRQQGPLDCLIVGDSMANDGPDPRVIEEAYQAETGAPLHCFNFGMPALMLDASGPLTTALNNRFQPRLMIVMLSARDFDPTYGVTFRHVASSDWTQHNLGKKSLRGWAVNSLYSYRYALFLRYWLNPLNRERFAEAWRAITPQGFTPLYGYGNTFDLTRPQADFQISDPAIQNGFDQLLQLKRAGVNLLIVDAPISPDYYVAYRDNLVEPYIQTMQHTLGTQEIAFWQTRDLSTSIASDGWYDAQHVNEIGVPVLSTWLGKQLAEHYPPDFFK
jgi:hypothetical protein